MQQFGSQDWRAGRIREWLLLLDDPRRTTTLKRHIARIDDSRLRRAFHAAVDVERKLAPAGRKQNGRDFRTGMKR